MEIITLDNLNTKNVVVVKEKVEEDGYISREHRTGYNNSIQGRIEVETEVAEPYKSVIFMIWGDNPTIDETVTGII